MGGQGDKELWGVAGVIDFKSLPGLHGTFDQQ